MIRPPPRSTLFPYPPLFRSPPDTTPPAVSITSPASGAIVSGTTVVTATASDNVGVVGGGDRKSTRLNSSHSQISYAVFCLKKKRTLHSNTPPTPPRAHARAP